MAESRANHSGSTSKRVGVLIILGGLAFPTVAFARQRDVQVEQGPRASAPSSIAAGLATLPPRPSLGEPRYVVHAVRFRAVDESGVDFPGSDEVFAVWDTPQDRMAVSKVFEDVDAGETRTFPPRQSCITPLQVLRDVPGDDVSGALFGGEGDEWTCRIVGRPAPIDFTVWLFEHDEYWWPLYTCFQEPSVTPKGCRDDLIGERPVTLTLSDLEQVLPTVGSTYEETVTLGGPCGHLSSGEICGYSEWMPTGPEYTFTYRITRAADAPPVLAP